MYVLHKLKFYINLYYFMCMKQVYKTEIYVLRISKYVHIQGIHVHTIYS